MDRQYVVKYLLDTVGPALRGGDGIGMADERVNKRTEAGLIAAFRRYICRSDEDDYFKVDDDDQLYVFNGRYFEWLEKADKVLPEILTDVMGDESLKIGLVYRYNSAKVIADSCLSKLIADEGCHFAADRRYVVFRNGVLDTKTGRLEDFSVKYKTDIVLDFDYKPEAVSALWDSVLERTVPDEGMRETFHQFCGCFLAKRDEYKIESLCFVVGPGRNGKSVICKAVVNVFGKGTVSSYSPQQLFRGGNQAEYHLADVNGKICNFCDDVTNADFSGGEMKSFVSGGEFTGRHPYSRRPTKVTKVPLMLCCANKIPPTTDDTDGYYRRFIIINAPNALDERDVDVTLESKLRADDVRSAIFNWIYSGYRAFVANGGKIAIASTVKEVVEEMKNNANSLRRWVTENRYVDAEKPETKADESWKPNKLDNDYHSLKEWYGKYKQYCMDYGEMPKAISSMVTMFKQMGMRGFHERDGSWYYMRALTDAEIMASETPLVQNSEDDDDIGDLPY